MNPVRILLYSIAALWPLTGLAAATAYAAFPTDDAAALWNFNDLSDANAANGANSALTVVGAVETGVELSESEIQQSRLRGGDGKAARFSTGSYLSAGLGANDELKIGGTDLTIYLRLKLPKLDVSCPVLSRHGGHDNLAYNVFAYPEYIGTEVGTTLNNQLLSGKARFAEMRNPDAAPTAWHDVVCRVNEAKLELFVDGRCVDEDFTLGTLRQNDSPLLIGAQTNADGQISAGFAGLIDTAAIWNRPLSNSEIQTLSGGVDLCDLRERTARFGSERMQYWQPPNDYFAGDTLPFWSEKDKTYHAVYLLDKRHHGSKNGFGAHQWAQATSKDLVHWEHQPLILSIEKQSEGSFCTGSFMIVDDKYYCFYTNRSVAVGGDGTALTNPDGKAAHGGGKFGVAVSDDGIHFKKRDIDNAWFKVPFGGGDPLVFRDANRTFHLYQGGSHRGFPIWSHAYSKDMKTWTVTDPVYLTEKATGECPEYFQWGKYFYLVGCIDGSGTYRISESSAGPWQVPARNNKVMPGMTYVPKVAPYNDDRRICCTWTRWDGWAGSLIFHELIQYPDGSLGEKFVEEMNPPTDAPVIEETGLKAKEKTWTDLPENYRLTLTLEYNPQKANSLLDYELLVGNRKIVFKPTQCAVLADTVRMERLDTTTGTLKIDLFVVRDILDVCINDSQAASFQIENANQLTIKDNSELLVNEIPVSMDPATPTTEFGPTEPGFTIKSLKVCPVRP